jgi:hypothetical protein
MTGPDQQMVEDFGNLFIERLHRLMTDCADTCHRGGLSYPDTIAILMTMLLHEAASGAHTNNLTARQFARVCEQAYRLQSDPEYEKKARCR